MKKIKNKTYSCILRMIKLVYFKLLFIILFVVFFKFISFSQLFQNENCGVNDNKIFTKRNHIDNEKLKAFLDSCDYSPYVDNVKYRVPVKFWIYRKSNGKDGLSLYKIKEHIRNLNYYYSLNNTGISFYLRPDFEYIDNDRLYKLNYYNQAPFQTMKHKCDGCINVYVTEKLEKSRPFKIKKNYSGTYNFFTDGVIVAKGISSSTLSHEIGHYFGLKHPHAHWQSKAKGEPVSRTKLIPGTNTRMCEKKGDGLCDTPAEPNLANYTDDKCNYTGWNVKDKYGVVYKPNTNNIMSYTRNRECRDNFTEEQKALMLYTASKKKYAKDWFVNKQNVEKYDFDYFEPDDLKEMASEIFFRTNQTHTFHNIFTPKENQHFSDKVDWLYFKLDVTKPQDITIQINKMKYDFPKLLITIFKDNKEVFKTEVIETKDIFLNNLDKGKYLIKIENISNINKIVGYKIKLDNSK